VSEHEIPTTVEGVEKAESFIRVLGLMREQCESHPQWPKRANGTPLDNDIPVRCANVACGLVRTKDATIARLEYENAGLRKRAEDSRLVVLYNGPASGCATVSGDWARRTFGPDRCAQITIEAIGNRLTVKPHTANGGGGGQ